MLVLAKLISHILGSKITFIAILGSKRAIEMS